MGTNPHFVGLVRDEPDFVLIEKVGGGQVVVCAVLLAVNREDDAAILEQFVAGLVCAGRAA